MQYARGARASLYCTGGTSRPAQCSAEWPLSHRIFLRPLARCVLVALPIRLISAMLPTRVSPQHVCPPYLNSSDTAYPSHTIPKQRKEALLGD